MQNDFISLSKDLIKKQYILDNRPWVIGYSGGKDSTTLVQIVLESIHELKVEGQPVSKQVFVISSDTLVSSAIFLTWAFACSISSSTASL